MTVRRMGRDDLDRVLDWAAAEGWNPGADDAAAFLAADPDGFFVKDVDGRSVAAVSVVNHSPEFAFLGLYICQPDFRGQGLGLEVWNAGMAHAGTRCVGLDGVPDQQSNYMRSGFTRHGRTTRYRGWLERGAQSDAGAHHPEDLLRADRNATGIDRKRFADTWFAGTPTRQTVPLRAGRSEPAFATFRKCREGIKIGPFHAETAELAEAVLACVPANMAEGPAFIDIPETAPRLAELVSARGFEPVFETARMYTGNPPRAQPPLYHAVATLELG